MDFCQICNPGMVHGPKATKNVFACFTLITIRVVDTWYGMTPNKYDTVDKMSFYIYK